jgi:CBS domain containing-hemolysin-like protein
VAGLCVSLTGAIPQVGAVLHSGEARLEVLEANPRLVRRVRITTDRAGG